MGNRHHGDRARRWQGTLRGHASDTRSFPDSPESTADSLPTRQLVGESQRLHLGVRDQSDMKISLS